MGSDGTNEKCSEILERIKNGEDELFSELIQIFKKRIFSVAYGFFREREEALDITQEVFLRLWKMRKRIESKDIEAWIMKVTKNVCIDHYRARKRRELKERVEGILKVENERREALKESLERALLLIPERQSFAFSLRFFNGMKLSEISEIMGISEGGVKSILFKAINNIKKIIKDKEK